MMLEPKWPTDTLHSQKQSLIIFHTRGTLFLLLLCDNFPGDQSLGHHDWGYFFYCFTKKKYDLGMSTVSTVRILLCIDSPCKRETQQMSHPQVPLRNERCLSLLHSNEVSGFTSSARRRSKLSSLPLVGPSAILLLLSTRSTQIKAFKIAACLQ